MMNALSLELIDFVVLELVKLIVRDTATDETAKKLLAPYARISKKFQAAVERHLYRVTQVSSQQPERFQAINAYPHRKAALQDLHYVIELPAYDPRRRYSLERHHEHCANQSAFQGGLASLWNVLGGWAKPPSLFLDLSASSPSDEAGFEADSRWLCPEHSLELDRQKVQLPKVECVNRLAVAKAGRRIHPAALNTIVLTLPNLRVLDLEMHAVQRRHGNLRAEYTAALAKTLQAPTLQQLEVLSLSLWEYPPANHHFQTGLGHDPSYPEGDILSHAIRELAQRSLKELNLSDLVPISPALFGAPEDGGGTEKVFPHLEHVQIRFPIFTYDGRWYYTGDPDDLEPEELDPDEQERSDHGPSLDSDSDSGSDNDSALSINMDRADFLNGNTPLFQWRTSPDPTMFNPLVRSATAATLRMPKLRNLLLTTEACAHSWSDYEEEMEPQFAININYATPGCYLGTLRYPNMSVEGDARCRWVVKLGPSVRWDMPEDIQEMMKEKMGEDGDVVIYRSRS
ncbi:hypothetical protein BDW66DRAFT_154438 [Aspergillus desertorum]